MLNKIKNRLQTLRAEHGATDPILVIAAIAVSLILLVGGSFAVQGIITNGKDLNAKGDLDKVAVAEVAYYAQFDAYVAYKKGTNTALEDSNLGFSPTEDDGADLAVLLDGAGWNAVAKSSSGKLFVKTSESNAIITLGSETAAQLAKMDLSPADITALRAAVA